LRAGSARRPPGKGTLMPGGDKRALLLIVDMLSDYGFPDAEQLLREAERPARHMRQARDAADEAGVMVAYANDLHGMWACSRDEICARALRGRRPDLVSPLLPRPDDAFMHKGQHSAFYGTPFAHLLHEEEIDELVLTGQVTEQCVLYTALDAHVRHYAITVLTDAVIPLERELGDAALRMMKRNMGARLLTTREWQSELV
jgi:nicotinamidase-related amidase